MFSGDISIDEVSCYAMSCYFCVFRDFWTQMVMKLCLVA